MKITEITQFSAEHVDTETNSYIRFNSENWLQQEGIGWAHLYEIDGLVADVSEIEAAYQEFKANN